MDLAPAAEICGTKAQLLRASECDVEKIVFLFISSTKTEGPSSDECINEEVACENSGLRRSSISDTSFVRKIVKIITVGDRGSGAH